jgi:MSHA biogenesis protein MshN
MSLINDMLNDLEKNKDKNNRTKTESLDSAVNGTSPEGTPGIPDTASSSKESTAPSMPPADEVKLTMDNPEEADTEVPAATNPGLSTEKMEKVSIPEDTTEKSSPDYQQPWETGQAETSPEEKPTKAPTLNSDTKIIDNKKPSQKRLIIWILIIGAACAVLAFLYFWPNSSKLTAKTSAPMAVPSAPLTPTIDIQKDKTPIDNATAVSETPADKPIENTTSGKVATTQEEANTKQASTTEEKSATPDTIQSDAIELQPVELSPAVKAQNAYDQIMSNMNTLSSYQAIGQLQGLLNEHPTFKPARTTLAAMLIKYGNSAQALTILEKGLTQTPSDKQMAELTAHILVEKNQITQALRILKQAQPATIQADPDYYALMAGLYLQEKDYLEAQNFYQALTDLNPQNGTWWAGLAITSAKLGQSQLAMSAYNRAETVGGLSPALQAYIDQTIQGS